MSRVTRKSVFKVFDQVRQTGLLSFRDKLESWNFGFSEYRYFTIRQRKTKVLIRLCGCAGWTASLLFAYDKSRFCHYVSHILSYASSFSSSSFLYSALPHHQIPGSINWSRVKEVDFSPFVSPDHYHRHCHVSSYASSFSSSSSLYSALLHHQIPGSNDWSQVKENGYGLHCNSFVKLFIFYLSISIYCHTPSQTFWEF